MDIVDALGGAGIIPVIVLESEADAVPLARVLVAGGLPVLEGDSKAIHQVGFVGPLRRVSVLSQLQSKV